jgi:hypothetical protein
LVDIKGVGEKYRWRIEKCRKEVRVEMKRAYMGSSSNVVPSGTYCKSKKLADFSYSAPFTASKMVLAVLIESVTTIT